MGIQVKVEIKDIPQEWDREVVKLEGNVCQCNACWHGEDWCDGPQFSQYEELRVKFPKSGWINSYSDTSLVFDNKTANMQFREELDEHKIPYVRW